MSCPKCAFEAVSPESSASCPRCGVVFSKLGRERPRPTRPRPAPAPVREPVRSRVSLVNVALLSVALSGTGVLLFERYRPEVEPDAVEGAPRERPSREVVVDVPPPAPSTLTLPGRTTPDPEDAFPAPTPAPVPELPPLRAGAVTQALIDEAVALSRQHPDVSELRRYIATAYLLFAGQKLRSGDARAALRELDRAEEWNADEGQVASVRALAFELEQEWELARQWATTALAYGARDNAAEMHHVIGKALYYREELDKAIEEFRAALDLRYDPRFQASLDRALIEAESSRGFDRQRLAHFIVRYEGETMEGTGRMVLDQMERSYASLISQLGFEPSEPVVVLLYSRQSYREMGGPHWSAGLFDGKIRVPVRGLEHLDEHVKSTLHHELAHAFIHARAGDRAPRWLHEGLAEYVEGTRPDEGAKLVAEVLERGRSFEGCLASAACDPRLFYPAATSMVDYMIQLRGIGGVRDLLASLGEGSDIDGALGRVVGRDQAGLIRDWEHFVQRRYGGARR